MIVLSRKRVGMLAESGKGLLHEEIQAAEGLLNFIGESPTAFHAVSALRARLDEAGFVFLPEAQAWSASQGDATTPCATVRAS